MELRTSKITYLESTIGTFEIVFVEPAKGFGLLLTVAGVPKASAKMFETRKDAIKAIKAQSSGFPEWDSLPPDQISREFSDESKWSEGSVTAQIS